MDEVLAALVAFATDVARLRTGFERSDAAAVMAEDIEMFVLFIAMRFN